MTVPTNPRVLVLLSQMPQDPASGAARSMMGIAVMLAARGFRVRALGTTVRESVRGEPAARLLEQLGHRPEVERLETGPARTLLRLNDAGVDCTLLDVGPLARHEWEPVWGEAFDRQLLSTIEEWKPDVLLTFGGNPSERLRRHLARRAGARVVFGLRNMSYMDRRNFTDVDAVLTPSGFVTAAYAKLIGLGSTPIPVPIVTQDVVAPGRQPLFVTFVNPCRHKGVNFFARLAEDLATRRPDLPVLVVDSRGNAGTLVNAGLRAGFDLRRHASLFSCGGVPRPREFLAVTRVLLVPSVWYEAAGRVAAEALVNGIPPIVSPQGGLPETVGQGGRVLPIAADPATLLESVPPPDDPHVRAWAGEIERLCDDPAYEAEAGRRARVAAARYEPETLADRYAAYFRDVLGRR
ncbi:MAG: glycosyltransferase [Phycisphaerae bacterium]|nr:glycosyltransferase [Phycisphaerae bacterium]